MPKIIERSVGSIKFLVPYYDELLMDKEIGRLSQDLACHALWYYYGNAMKQLKRAKENIVYEDEPSHQFDMNIAQGMIRTAANIYGVSVEQMVRYWDLVERQRIALGGGDTLPSEYKFQFSMRN